jgi:N-acetyl-anhydromuramoyl-L-alanine amidase
MPRRVSRNRGNSQRFYASPVSVWKAGWLQSAQQLASSNFGNRPLGTVVDVVVIHSISLPPGRYGGGEVQDLFTNQLDWDAHPYFQSIRGLQVSAHFYISREGKLWQFVSCDDRAWHAGVSSFQGRDNCNDYSIGIELEGLEGGEFEAAQYTTLSRLCRDLRLRYPIVSVVGHEHIAPNRKLDPGPGFNWPLLAQSVVWNPQCFPFLLDDPKK